MELVATTNETDAATASLVDYQTHPDRYRHYKVSYDGPVATMKIDIDEDRGIRPGSRKRRKRESPASVRQPFLVHPQLCPQIRGRFRPARAVRQFELSLLPNAIPSRLADQPRAELGGQSQ